MNRPTPYRRIRGFTLIELLIVVVIIAVLIALLLPVINGALRGARSAAVQSEINQLAQALNDFKSKFGDFPPSRVLLNESGYIDTTSTIRVPSGGRPNPGVASDITLGQLGQRTLTAMRKFWPRATFSTAGPVFLPASTTWYDFNGSGTKDFTTPYVLQGHESLVFFLGGIPLYSGGTVSVTGFGKTPTNPFSNGIVGNAMYSANRNPPFFEFRSERLRLTQPNSLQTAAPAYTATVSAVFDAGGNPIAGNPGYIDSIDGLGNSQSFYAYFSTNLGVGYDPNDVNLGTDEDSNATSPMFLRFLSNQMVIPQSNGMNVTDSATPNPYTSSPTFGGAGTVAYQNPQSFQIISPGIDGFYGLGGAYAGNGKTPLPSQSALSNSTDESRAIERDNLTNFHNGRLE